MLRKADPFPWVLCAVLLIMYFLVRLPNLRALSVFADEATYLRWGQLIAQDPWGNLFISMEDAKLPLHYWLLAPARVFGGDPVVEGRLLSVLFGALTLIGVIAVCGEMCTLVGRRQVKMVAGVTGLFFIFSPLVAFYQRMAVAESLLMLESVAIAWTGLRLARHITEQAPSRTRWIDAVQLGLCWAAVLLTKQNFSYVLWGLPWAAMLVWMTRAAWRQQVIAFAKHYMVSTAIGVACFVPVVMTSTTHDLRTRIFYKPVFTTNTVYGSRAEMIWGNVMSLISPRAGGELRLWPHQAGAPLEQGLFYVYLTPPLLLLVLAGLVWTIRRHMPREAWFMGAWAAVLLGTVIVGANVLYSRYIVAGVLVLILFGAWTWTDLLLSRRILQGRIVTAMAIAFLLVWPAAATISGVIDCRAAIHTREDRAQYLAEGACGDAAEDAVEWLKTEAAKGKITVVTGDGLGVQDDLAWLMLRREANVTLFAHKEMPRLAVVEGQANAFQLKREQWVPAATGPIEVSPESPIYVLAAGALDHRTGKVEYPRQESPGVEARFVREFLNPGIVGEAVPTHGVAVYRLLPMTGAARAKETGATIGDHP